jgi:hypothetical protein
MGLVYDTAVAALRPHVGHRSGDPKFGWNFHLYYGIDREDMSDPWKDINGSDESDDDMISIDDGVSIDDNDVEDHRS